jgi:hypothetical protein
MSEDNQYLNLDDEQRFFKEFANLHPGIKLKRADLKATSSGHEDGQEMLDTSLFNRIFRNL